MVRPDLFEIAKTAPQSLNPNELIILGLAHIGIGIEDVTAPAEGVTSGMGIVSDGLRQIRTNPQFSESQRLATAIEVIGDVDFSKLPEVPETVTLFYVDMSMYFFDHKDGDGFSRLTVAKLKAGDHS